MRFFGNFYKYLFRKDIYKIHHGYKSSHLLRLITIQRASNSIKSDNYQSTVIFDKITENQRDYHLIQN